MSVLRKANSLISPQARPELWSQLLSVLCGLWKVSRRAHSICSSISATSQAVPDGSFQGWVVALLWLLPSAKCWRVSKHNTTIALSETWSIFLYVQETGLDMLRWEVVPLLLAGTLEPVKELWMPTGTREECMAWLALGKTGHFSPSRAEWYRPDIVGAAGLQFWTFSWDLSFCLSCAQR